VASEALDGSLEEADDGRGVLLLQHLGVGQASAVVDRDMDVLPADRFATNALGVCSARAMSFVERLARDPVASARLDASELFDVDVEQLARPGTLIARSGLDAKPAELPIPILVGIPETVESAIPDTSAISGPVNRSRRSAAIASTRRPLVRRGIECGAEERSSSPSSPSAR